MRKLPLPEYCTVARASRLLGCEVEDLLHWGVEGLITLMINLELWRYEEGVELAEITREAGISLSNITQKDALPEEPESKHVSISSKAGYFISDNHDFGMGRFAMLYGFWIATPSTIEDRYLGFKETELHLIATTDDDALIDEKSITTAIMPIEEHLQPTYWISKKQMELLLSGKPLTPRFSWDTHHQNTKSSHEPFTPHHSAERCAANRELVLAAAIYAKLNSDWCDERDDKANLWADKILNHEAILFDNRMCPVSRDKVERMLGAAMNSGKVDKSR